ncbi:hypothetical protein D918_01482 [Trichuris suis]|nr:hypothetical protein D918_01482 [Trichuris suis]
MSSGKEHSKRRHKKFLPRQVITRYYDKAKFMLQDESSRESRNQCALILLRGILCVTCITTIGFCAYMAYVASKVVMEYRAIFDPVKVTDNDIIAMLTPSYSLETYVCVGIFGFAVYLMMASLQGLNGAVTENKLQIKLYCYCLLFPVVIGGIVALILTFAIAEETRNNYVTWAYETGLRRLYGSGRNVDIWSFAVDVVQKEKKCCGYNASTLANNNNTATYLTILFWLESTNWGVKQVDAVHYNESAQVEFVPKSCCKEQKPDCNVGLLYDRLTWDDEKERKWAARIYNVGCRGRLPGLGELYFGIGNPLFTIFYCKANGRL